MKKLAIKLTLVASILTACSGTSSIPAEEVDRVEIVLSGGFGSYTLFSLDYNLRTFEGRAKFYDNDLQSGAEECEVPFTLDSAQSADLLARIRGITFEGRSNDQPYVDCGAHYARFYYRSQPHHTVEIGETGIEDTGCLEEYNVFQSGESQFLSFFAEVIRAQDTAGCPANHQRLFSR